MRVKTPLVWRVVHWKKLPRDFIHAMFNHKQCWLAIVLATALSAAAQAETIDFESAIAPIFIKNCISCHNDHNSQGSLSLQSRSGALADSDSGQVIAPGDPEGSLLLEMVSGPNPEMPKQTEPLSAAEVSALRSWIKAGAKWPESVRLEARDTWWSRQPLVQSPVPRLSSAEKQQVRTPVDAFILAKLTEQGLSPSSLTDARTFVRRVYFDLIGLPPSPQQIRQFQQQVATWNREHPNQPAEPLPNAIVRQLVNELLDSPHYGERWARHWLDVVKYADTCGYDKDKLRPNAWPYRDYVIRSLNDDKPYGQFIQEQLAGDALFPGEPDGILGLGFIAAGPWDFIGHVEVAESKSDGKVARNLDRDDMVSNTLNTFCSVTIQCARCHDHKFDPYTQQHYYGLQAVFAAVDRADRVYDADPKIESVRLKLSEQIKELTTQLAKPEAKTKPKATDEPVAASDSAPDEAQKKKLAKLKQQLAELPPRKLVYAATTEFPAQGNFKATKGKPRMVNVLQRGNVNSPAEAALPGALPLPQRPQSEFPLAASHREADRRAALAEWISDRENPLTWRSIVNRVWLYHFGQGIVDSPNDFGRMGQQPTHPALLDWLAVELRDSGQSLKELHRLIVTSRTYLQASTHGEANAAIDSGNRFLWRMNRRRLEAEEIRDAILTVSGRLNRQLGGPGFYLFELEKAEHSPHYEYHKFDPEDPTTHRRTIYRFIVRSQPDPLMTTLDCADSSQSTPKREETLNALQSLSLLNNRFNLVMAKHFATHTERQEESLAGQVSVAMQLAIGRPPNATEQGQMVEYARQFGMSNLCRAIFNFSEFVYLD